MKVANAAFVDLLPCCADSQDLEYGGLSTISLLSQESSKNLGKVLDEWVGVACISACVTVREAITRRWWKFCYTPITAKKKIE